MFDILIKNGTIIDGTGRKSYRADVAVEKDKIVKIGKLEGSRTRKEIDAGGKIVAPGFIDIHNHSDSYWRIFLEPTLPSLIYQGVTTIIGGNCGASIAPLTDGRIIESIQKWVDMRQVNVDWLSMAEFVEKMSTRKFAVNFGTLVGHGTLRRGLVMDEMRRLEKSELKVLGRLLEQAMQSGALGLSSGLAYSHERKAGWDEMLDLAEIVKYQGKVYATHLKNESHNLIFSLEEAIDVAKDSGVSMEISHLKATGKENWGLMDQALEMIDKAREESVDINFDVYPYTMTAAVLYFFLPDWAVEGGRQMMLKRLKADNMRKKIVQDMRRNAEYDYGEAIVASSSLSKTLTRRTLGEIARGQESSIEEAIINLLLASEGRVTIISECLSEENLKKALKHPLSIVASDGAGYDASYGAGGELVHPRSFGTFPRVLGKYVREEKVLDLEEAVRKMTSLPARKFNIENRGILAKNYQADIVIFDQDKICDKATVENPFQYAEGISEVIVNGKLALTEGKITEVLAGKFITG
jgi:N-acyl-D-amino-acid deacylase